jgi:hypothetical protein
MVGEDNGWGGGMIKAGYWAAVKMVATSILCGSRVKERIRVVKADG